MPEAEKIQPEEAPDAVGEAEDQEMETEMLSTPSILSLKLLPLTKSLHAKHGLRHGDYQRYRGYCSRRLARLRKALKIVQGDRKRFVKKEITTEILENAAKSNPAAIAEAKHLQIPLMSCERAWAYAMQLKFELNTEPRKKYHMINRLKKAAKYAGKLEALCMDSNVVDARTKLEARAYVAWLAGSLAFETQAWTKALGSLNQAKTIYEQLSSTLSEEEAAIYKARIDEIIPSLRYCAYNIGDASARQDLMSMTRGGLQGQELNELINQTREQQASTLQEVEWRGRKMAVKQEKVRLFLLREQEFQDELARQDSVQTEKKISAYESLLMDCKDAIQVLRDDLIEDPTFRSRQQSKEGPVTSAHFLYTYLTFIKCSKTIDRNLVMIEGMKRILSGEEVQDKGKKPVKPQDLARLYETIIQNLNDLPQLAGLEDDLAFKQEIETQVGFYKAARCYYIALTFLSNQKWAEAMALFQRATAYANKAKNDKTLPKNLQKEVSVLVESIEGRQFMAHANSILEGEEVTRDGGTQDVSISDAKKVPLIDRLDVYYEDNDLAKGKANLVPFPPSFTPIPCKPLFFDLAHEHLTFPALEEKMTPPGQAGGQGASGGWLGGWLGWGSKAKK